MAECVYVCVMFSWQQTMHTVAQCYQWPVLFLRGFACFVFWACLWSDGLRAAAASAAHRDFLRIPAIVSILFSPRTGLWSSALCNGWNAVFIFLPFLTRWGLGFGPENNVLSVRSSDHQSDFWSVWGGFEILAKCCLSVNGQQSSISAYALSSQPFSQRQLGSGALCE